MFTLLKIINVQKGKTYIKTLHLYYLYRKANKYIFKGCEWRGDSYYHFIWWRTSSNHEEINGNRHENVRDIRSHMFMFQNWFSLITRQKHCINLQKYKFILISQIYYRLVDITGHCFPIVVFLQEFRELYYRKHLGFSEFVSNRQMYLICQAGQKEFRKT